MKKILPLLAACICLLSGCSALLERSFGEVEPYADRYWDSGAEDTLRAESYQDLVNSLLMLVEQRAETGTIRCYGEANAYAQARAAAREVREDTMLGSYLLEDLQFTYETNEAGGYCILQYEMDYREDAEDMAAIMTLSDSQSLVDLLRLAVREGHGRLTVRFSYDMPRENVIAAVESLWTELCQDEWDRTHEQEQALQPGGEDGEPDGGETEHPDAPPEGENGAEPPADGEDGAAAPEEGDGPDAGAEPPEDGAIPADGEITETPPLEFPPCPWQVRFYPDMDTADLVEILLEDA